MEIFKSKRSYIVLAILFVAVLPVFLFSFVVQQKEPWSPDQLMEPGDLAFILNDPQSQQPIVVSVGPGAVIKGSHQIGPTVENVNLKKLEDHLETLQRDANVVIYCGCCPFNKCPNIRPAFAMLNTKGFKNHKLLNLPQNVKADWIDRGYPVNE